MLKITRRGFDRVVTLLEGVQSEKQMVEIVRDVTAGITRFGASINPVDTGAMRDSWTWIAIGLMGKMYISLSAFNPRSYLPVIRYAPFVDERVGLLDAVMDEGERIATESLGTIVWEPR